MLLDERALTRGNATNGGATKKDLKTLINHLMGSAFEGLPKTGAAAIPSDIPPEARTRPLHAEGVGFTHQQSHRPFRRGSTTGPESKAIRRTAFGTQTGRFAKELGGPLRRSLPDVVLPSAVGGPTPPEIGMVQSGRRREPGDLRARRD